MFRIIRRLGCLVVLAVVGVVAWMTRDLWMERVTGRAAASEVSWEAASPQREAAAHRRLNAFSAPKGPAYANFTGGEAASLILGEAARRFPTSVSDVRGAIRGEELHVQATVDLSDAKGLERLGPAAKLLSTRRRVTLAGVPSVAESGRGTFAVRSVRIDEVYLPPPAIAFFVDQLIRDSAATNSRDAAVSFPLPGHIGDLRVANGSVTLYKRVP